MKMNRKKQTVCSSIEGLFVFIERDDKRHIERLE